MGPSKVTSFRWIANVSEWNPTVQEWGLAMRTIQPEERDRVGKFRYKNDAKASVLGRLLMHKWARIVFPGLVVFARDERGRPRVVGDATKWDFNVSHAGDYTAFVAENKDWNRVERIGVDVMRLSDFRFGGDSEKIGEFFRIMRRKFAQSEWGEIRSKIRPSDQMATFFRFWSLKESYVKALGDGLSLDLRNIQFSLASPLSNHLGTANSRLRLQGDLIADWRFDEFLAPDGKHCISTAINFAPPDAAKVAAVYPLSPFDELSPGEILPSDDFKCMASVQDKEEWLKFSAMEPVKPF